MVARFKGPPFGISYGFGAVFFNRLSLLLTLTRVFERRHVRRTGGVALLRYTILSGTRRRGTRLVMVINVLVLHAMSYILNRVVNISDTLPFLQQIRTCPGQVCLRGVLVVQTYRFTALLHQSRSYAVMWTAHRRVVQSTTLVTKHGLTLHLRISSRVNTKTYIQRRNIGLSVVGRYTLMKHYVLINVTLSFINIVLSYWILPRKSLTGHEFTLSTTMSFLLNAVLVFKGDAVRGFNGSRLTNGRTLTNNVK